jgi:hypothetical protein
LAGIWERDARITTDPPEEFIRHLEEDASAVTGIRFAPAGPAVIEVPKNRQSVSDDNVRLDPMNVNKKTNTTGVMLESGIVESLFRRGAARAGRFLFYHVERYE